MYVPIIPIDCRIHTLLLRWGMSTGYEVKANDSLRTLYDLKCNDPIRMKELLEAGQGTGLTRQEAAELVRTLTGYATGEDVMYNPYYTPPVRLDEDMFDNYFMPYMDSQRSDYKVTAEHEGIFWQIQNVSYLPAPACTMSRSDLTELVRDLEFDRRMPQFIVRYQCGGTSKMWQKGIDSYEAAAAILEREKPRHSPAADWKIYAEHTAAFRHLEELPEGTVETPDWLWLKIWHPGRYGSDYWSHGFYDDLSALQIDMIQDEEIDFRSVTAIYACRRHDAPPEEEVAAPSSKWHLVSTMTKPQDTETELAGGIAVMWAKSGDKIYILFTPDADDVDNADIEALVRSLRTTAPVPDFDHAYLYPVYRGVKREGGVGYEMYFIHNDDPYEGSWHEAAGEQSVEASLHKAVQKAVMRKQKEAQEDRNVNTDS